MDQEEIKNMSPEELREFQKKQCIFCHIVSGKVQSRKLYEDEDCIAFLDINPATKGHVLIIPKEHFQIMPLMPDDLVGRLFVVAKRISNAVFKGMKVDGTHIFVQNGMAAGQKAQHVMIHVIPRSADDGLAFTVPQKQLTPQDMKAVHDRVTTRLNELLGIKPDNAQKPPKPQDAPEKEQPTEPQQPKRETKDKTVDLDSIAKLLKNG